MPCFGLRWLHFGLRWTRLTWPPDMTTPPAIPPAARAAISGARAMAAWAKKRPRRATAVPGSAFTASSAAVRQSSESDEVRRCSDIGSRRMPTTKPIPWASSAERAT
jgi:hypothetical protein